MTSDSKLGFGGGKASPAGNALSYFSRYPAEGSQVGGQTWLSARTADGWVVEGLEPQMTTRSSLNGRCEPGVALSEDLDAFILAAGGELYSSPAPNPNGECEKPEEELVPGEPRGYSNLYLHENGSYSLLNSPPSETIPGNATYQAASNDLSRVVFTEDAQLTPGSTSGSNLFEWADGIMRFVAMLPNGEATEGDLAASYINFGGEIGPEGKPTAGLAPVSHAVSADGERVFFEANGSLYLRENAGQAPAADGNCNTTSETELACTLRLDKSFGEGENGGGVFLFASRDGSRVFFVDDHKLTSPSSAEAGKPALYEYRVETREIVDLTVNPAKAVANVRGFSGGSDDGSRLYFVARGIITGSEENGQGEKAQAGQPNLYLVREGVLTYVATLSPWEEKFGIGGKDASDWWEPGPERSDLKTAWSPSGRYLLFSSHKSLTGFDNTPAEPGLCKNRPACEELFLYDADAGDLNCLSCDPGGANPVENSKLEERLEFTRFGPGPRYAPRVVLDSGQVFFETVNPLAGGDVNGFQDVYEFHAGSFRLISSGTAAGGSTFVDASIDGSDVFFITPDPLVGRDRDGSSPSIYDARIEGGFAEPPPPPEPCNGEDSCRAGGAATAPPASPSATATFAGSGNVKVKPCKRGKVRRGEKCVKKKHRHHRHHRAGNNRGSN